MMPGQVTAGGRQVTAESRDIQRRFGLPGNPLRLDLRTFDPSTA